MAEDRTGFDDLFDFSDESPINKGLAGIQKLESGYAAFIKQAMQQNDQLRKELAKLATEMKQTGSAMGQLSVSTKQGRDEAGRMAAALHKQTQQYSDLKLKLQDQINKTRQLSKEHRDLQKSYNLLSKAQNRAAADAKRVATKEAESKIAIAKKEAESKLRIAEAEAKSRIKLEEEVTRAQRREAERRIKEARREAQLAVREAERQARAQAMRGAPGSINDLKSQRERLTNNFNNLGNSPADLQIKDAQVQEVNRLTRAIQEQQAAMLLARKGAIAARDSYSGLVQENARIMQQLRLMPNAFDLVTGEINEQNREARELARQYRQNTAALQGFDQQLGRHHRNVGNYAGALGVVGNSMRQFALGLVGQFAGMYALAEATRIAWQSNLELSDSQAGVMKTVGLTKKEVDDLAESFKKIDTRTTLTGLFDIARIGGQFGVAAQDIESFTEAADRAAVALGDEFKGGVEEVATELYTLRGLFTDTKEMSPADAMLAIGSAINSLGASGAATGPIVAEFAKRLGQLGDMGPDIQTALGLGAALQELGLSAEIAAGGYANIIIQLKQTKNAERAAKFMGVTTAAFKEMLANDPNELLLQMAISLNGNVEKMREFGVMSQESIKVWNTMGKSADRVRELVKLSSEEFAKATSINKEFAVVNDTLAASWDKLKNSIVNTMTSGSIGNWLKEQVDGIRLFGKELSNLFGGESANNVSSAASMMLGSAEQLEYAQELINKINEINSYAKQNEANKRELADATRQLNALMGEEALAVSATTGKYVLSTAAMERHKATIKGTTEETIKQLKISQEAEKVAQEEETAAKKRYNAMLATVNALKEQTGYSMFGVAVSKELRMAQDALKEAEVELEAAQKKRNNILEDQRVATEMLTKAGYSQLEIQKLLQAEWLKNADAVKQGEAVWGKQNPFGQMTQEDGIPDDTGSGTSTAQSDALKKMQDAAREARHKLELLQAQIKATRAEWLKMDLPDMDWEMPNFATGMEEQMEFMRQEFRQLEALYRAHTTVINMAANERIKVAETEAREKRRHNEAGKDGLILIEAELNEAIAQINHEREIEHIKMLERLTKAEQKAADGITAILKKNAAERSKVASEILDNSKENMHGYRRQYEKDVQFAEDMERLKQEIVRASFETMSEFGNAFFDLKQMRLQEELEYLRYNQEQELAAAGDNEQLKFEINERYRKKDLELRQKQAKAAKAQAIMNIILSTAQGVMTALATPPGVPYTIPLAALVGAMGAAQLVVAASAPIPQFYRGVKDAPEGPARVAEVGSELAISPDGKLTYYDKPQVAYLEQGTEVKTASETRAILSRLEHTYGANGTKALVNSFNASERALNSPKQDAGPRWSDLVGEMRKTRKETVKAIKSQRQPVRNADGSVTDRNGSTWNTYVNKKYNRG